MRLYMPQKHEIYVFLQFLESFRGKMYKNIFYRKWRMDSVWDSKNYKWLCTTYFEHFMSSLAEITNEPRKNEQYCYFSLTVEDRETFARLLFWSDFWVTAPVFQNRFLVVNLYLITVMIQSKRRIGPSLHKSNLTMLFTFKACLNIR